MSAGRSFGLVAIAVTVLSGWGIVRLRAVMPLVPSHGVSLGSAPLAKPDSLDELLATAEDLTVTNDLFRLANAPASVRFDPNNENSIPGAAAMSQPPIRPTMTLKAIVGGPPWHAVVDGIPGQQPGTVVRAGVTFDKLTVRAVTRDSVVIQGPDTTWVLSFRRSP